MWAHKSGIVVVMMNDLERFGVRWRLRAPYMGDIISDDEGGVQAETGNQRT